MKCEAINCLLILLFCVIDLEYAACYKCQFQILQLDYKCIIIPDLTSIREKHFYGKTNDDVKEIDLSGAANAISHLTQSNLTPFCQRFKRLKKIIVKDFNSVDENLFHQCKNLNQVWIIKQLTPKKRISYLPSNIFSPLKKLHQLNLSNNKIQSLNPKWFGNLQSLEHLFLCDNEIQDLPKNIFINLEKLSWLDLEGNKLTTIHSDSFGAQRNLWMINLKSNKIISIDRKFINKTAVKVLDMSGNICSNDDIKIENEIKEKLSRCFNSYRSRDDLSKQKLN